MRKYELRCELRVRFIVIISYIIPLKKESLFSNNCFNLSLLNHFVNHNLLIRRD